MAKLTEQSRKKTGPAPKRLAIPANWKDAVAKALKRGKPGATPPPKRKRRSK